MRSFRRFRTSSPATTAARGVRERRAAGDARAATSSSQARRTRVVAFRSNNRASLAAVGDLVARGNGLLAGCDGLVPGFCLHDELEWMTKAGLTPIQALQAATINPAMYLWPGEDPGHDHRRHARRSGAAGSGSARGHSQHAPYFRRRRARPAAVQAGDRPHRCGSQATMTAALSERGNGSGALPPPFRGIFPVAHPSLDRKAHGEQHEDFAQPDRRDTAKRAKALGSGKHVVPASMHA